MEDDLSIKLGSCYFYFNQTTSIVFQFKVYNMKLGNASIVQCQIKIAC